MKDTFVASIRSARWMALAGVVALSGCAPSYTLVPPAPIGVARNTIHATPGTAWNKAPRTPLDTAWEEHWTQNGLLLDQITFFGGVPEGQAIAKQRPKAARQVPVFRATMSPDDLVAMLDSYYRVTVGATVFDTKAVVPVTFVGRPALQIDFVFVAGDELRRRGRAIVAIDKGRLYLMALSASDIHYFDAALPEYTKIAAAARD